MTPTHKLLRRVAELSSDVGMNAFELGLLAPRMAKALEVAIAHIKSFEDEDLLTPGLAKLILKNIEKTLLTDSEG